MSAPAARPAALGFQADGDGYLSGYEWAGWTRDVLLVACACCGGLPARGCEACHGGRVRGFASPFERLADVGFVTEADAIAAAALAAPTPDDLSLEAHCGVLEPRALAGLMCAHDAFVGFRLGGAFDAAMWEPLRIHAQERIDRLRGVGDERLTHRELLEERRAALEEASRPDRGPGRDRNPKRGEHLAAARQQLFARVDAIDAELTRRQEESAARAAAESVRGAA